MLTLTRKEYDIEEPIQVKGPNGETLVDYVMKITPEEKIEIRNIIFDEQDVKDGRLMDKLHKENNTEALEKLEEEVLEKAKKRQERFEEIIFKEEKENIKLKSGESVYLDLIDMIFDFFVKAFVDKKAQQVNTMSSHLRKISNK